MNWHRKMYDKKKRNKFARELEEPKYRHRVIPSRRERKPKPINLTEIETNADNSDSPSRD